MPATDWGITDMSDRQTDPAYQSGYAAGQVEAYLHSLFVFEKALPVERHSEREKGLMLELHESMTEAADRKRLFDRKTNLE